MFDHHDIQDTLSQRDAIRPPQLNQAICDYHSSHGSGGQDGDGGNKEGDGVSTLVASDESDMEEDFAGFSGDTALNASFEGHIPTPGPSEYVDELRARIERFINGAEGFQQMARVDIPSHLFNQDGFPHDYDGDSMRPEPSSDVHSVAASDARSVRAISPGPGIGEWVEKLPREYHFLRGPLRLTPQHRYCRGLVASHLVLRDGEAFVAGENGLRVDGHLHQG